MKNITVLVSGGGTNLQALIDAQQSGGIKNGSITRVISSNPNAYALQRAEKAGISSVVISRKAYGSSAEFDKAMLCELDKAQTDLIVLAGFMYILGKTITDKYRNRIINVHPALIPSFCGEGFYGLRVHKAALEYGVKLTGATVHFVNEQADAARSFFKKR